MSECKIKKIIGECILCNLRLPHVSEMPFGDYWIKAASERRKNNKESQTFIEELKKSLKDNIKVEKRFIPIYQYVFELFYSYKNLQFLDEIKLHDKRHIIELFSKVATDPEINDLGCDCVFSRHLVTLASSCDERLAKDSQLASEVFFELQDELINIFWSAQKVIFEEIFEIARRDYKEFSTTEEN